MAIAGASRPDWCDGGAYAGLAGLEPAALAWEWLRRDGGYRAAARVARGAAGSRSPVGVVQPGAAAWGLHAFEDPDRPAGDARPVWRAAWLPRVLPAAALREGAGVDLFELERFAGLATLVRGRDGAEHLLLADGRASLRLDVTAGTLLAGPVRLAYHLAGLASARPPLDTLEGLLWLARHGHLPRPRHGGRQRRLVLLLRTADALAAGASQREIAEVFVSPAVRAARWRTEAPSLRSQAQRLVRGARAMSAGGYRALLRI